MKNLLTQKLTKAEKAWVLYDVGNSAFTLLITTIMPIYFNYLTDLGGLSSEDYLAYWGYAASISTLLVALIGPIAGTIADYKGFKKPIFVAAITIGCVCCLALGLARQWLIFLIIFIIAKVGYSSSLVFYDAMLSDITTPERMDNVSSQGFAWGYIGSCIPFVLCLGVVLTTDITGLSMTTAMMIAFLIVGAWWIGNTLPLLKVYKQRHYIERQPGAVKMSFKRLWDTLRHMKGEKYVFIFLLAFFFYIDGVHTIIEMATAYGSALGLDTTGLLLALLTTQIVAFPFSILFGRLAAKYRSDILITIAIIAYFCIAVFAAAFLKTQVHFWILAVCVGMFQGGIQALSRSWFARILPPDKSGEYFALYDICGKGASFMGTTVVSLVTQLTGESNLGVATVSLFFIIGLIFFRYAVKITPKNAD